MKAVLISIRPEWCEKILNGEKTVEVRKSQPRLKTPFKVYIYCTSVTRLNLENYVSLHRKTAGSVDYWSGKVIAEFICDSVTELAPLNHSPENVEEMACLTREQIVQYCRGRGFAWHISDLKVYDRPKEVSDFMADRLTTTDCYQLEALKQPPQSWCYVEEAEP